MTFESMFYDENSRNQYISDDKTESWFDYKIDNINYFCERKYDKYIIGAWFDGLNFKNRFHVCRFQVVSDDFTKAFHKIKKLCNQSRQKGIIFDGGYDYYENTKGYYWKSKYIK